MSDILLKLEKKDKASLGMIRCLPSVVATEDEECIWVRVQEVTGEIDPKLKQLPVKSTFSIDEQNQLFLPNGLTPVAILPEMHWVPIQSFLPVEPPVSNLPGETKSKVAIRLVPSTTERRGDALLTDLSTWKAYAEQAPAIRLASLKFAVSSNNEVLILGTPLPSLPGKEFWLKNNSLIPCGYAFEIPFALNFLQNEINPAGSGLVLFSIDCKWQLIDRRLFVEAKRSAIRLTTNAASST